MADLHELLKEMLSKFVEADTKTQNGEDSGDGFINVRIIGQLGDLNFLEKNSEYITAISIIQETFDIEDKTATMFVISYLDTLDGKKDGLITLPDLKNFVSNLIQDGPNNAGIKALKQYLDENLYNLERSLEYKLANGANENELQIIKLQYTIRDLTKILRHF